MSLELVASPQIGSNFAMKRNPYNDIILVAY